MMRNQQGKLFVVGWESARVMLVAADLRKIFTRFSGMRNEVLRTLAGFSTQGSEVIRPEVQMALILAADTAMRGKSKENMIQYFKFQRA